MKTYLYILTMIVLLSSCNKDEGRVLYKINFTTNDITLRSSTLLKSAESGSDSLYTQFGDYITSLTPTKFVALIWSIGYVDTIVGRSDNNAQVLAYIDQNVTRLPLNDPSRIVDFSDNITVDFNPLIGGRLKRNSQFEDQQIDFKYFYFMPKYFYQIVQLPAAYTNVTIV